MCTALGCYLLGFLVPVCGLCMADPGDVTIRFAEPDDDPVAFVRLCTLVREVPVFTAPALRLADPVEMLRLAVPVEILRLAVPVLTDPAVRFAVPVRVCIEERCVWVTAA